MTRTLCAFVALWAALQMDTAFAQCSSTERRQMRDAGLSASRIARLCEPDEDEDEPRSRLRSRESTPSRSSSPTNICQTPTLWCSLMQVGPPGLPCWCNTPFGPLNGVLR